MVRRCNAVIRLNLTWLEVILGFIAVDYTFALPYVVPNEQRSLTRERNSVFKSSERLESSNGRLV